MADWKVSKEIVEVKTHPNADKLDVLKVGEYQLVSGKGNYKTGDTVVIIPEKSIIPKNSPIYEEYEKYLTGPDKDRVKGIRLRGEFSEAITWPLDKLSDAIKVYFYDLDKSTPAIDLERVMTDLEVVQDASIGEDISEFLGIKKYEAPIPYNMKGEIEAFKGTLARKHDVYQYASYADEIQGQVMITEKLHGSQINYFWYPDGTSQISSKGILKRDQAIKESDQNLYWQAARNSDLKGVAEIISAIFRVDKQVQLIGEVIPVQKGYTYGQTEKVVKLFEVLVDGKSIPFSQMVDPAVKLWVPIIYIGDINEVDLAKLSKGKEQVSGNEEHIKEGIVIKTVDDKKAEDGKRLVLKVINPKYKDEDSFN